MAATVAVTIKIDGKDCTIPEARVLLDIPDGACFGCYLGDAGLDTHDECMLSQVTIPPRSGAEARSQGRVEEYAWMIKAKLIEDGQSEDHAEAQRLSIIARFGT